MKVEDFKIKRTKLPSIPEGTEFRCENWREVESNDITTFPKHELISFGSVTFKDEEYILADNPFSKNHFMFLISDIERIAKEQGMIVETKTLPKSFACKNTNQELWDKYIMSLSTPSDPLSGYNRGYFYGINKYGRVDMNTNRDQFDTILSLEEWDEIVNSKQTQIKEEVMKTNEITKDQLKQIHDVACSGWKAKIIEFAARNPFGNTVEFTSKEVEEMFKASDNKQTKVLESIFGSQQQELDFRSNDINFKQDGIKVFGNSNDLKDAFIGLPTLSTSKHKFFLNPDYVWKLNGDMLICTRK
jgi:hypothetical protein